MIRISALSLRDSFLEDLKLMIINSPDIMQFYLGHEVNKFNKQYNLITDIIIVDTSVFDPQKGEICREIKRFRPDILIMAVMDFKTDTNIAAWMSAGIDGIIPHYLGDKELHASLMQLFTKRKYIHPDLAAFVFSYFQTASFKQYTASGLKPKSLKVLDLLSKGKSYEQIADELDTSIDSVRYYIKDIYGTLGIKNKGAAVGMYLRGQIA